MASDLAPVRIILHGFRILRAFRRPVTRTDYASGLMAAKKIAKPVTGTRGRGSTVTRAMPASRGIGLRGTRHQEPTRIRAALSAAVVGPSAVLAVRHGCGGSLAIDHSGGGFAGTHPIGDVL